jgi:hypothetical protein
MILAPSKPDDKNITAESLRTRFIQGNIHGCKPIKKEDLIDADTGRPSNGPNTFIMVQRGGWCSNPTKVRNIQ